MIQTKEKTMTNDEFIKKAETQFKEWLGYFNRLEDTIRDAGASIEQTYHERIADLEHDLRDIEQSINDLKSSDPDHWEERKYRFHRASWTYTQSYATLFNDMKKDERRPAGWLEGFTDQPPTGSDGWLEGTDAHATGSEGWVEGMAERSPKSEGWKEGYATQETA